MYITAVAGEHMPDRVQLSERPQEERQTVPQLGDLGAEIVVDIPHDEAGVVEKCGQVEQSRIARPPSGNVKVHAQHDDNQNTVTNLRVIKKSKLSIRDGGEKK